MLKILLVIANQGYQPIEYEIPKKLMAQAGIKVITASNQAGIATASDGSQTNVDITLDQVNTNDYGGIFFIGGPGAITDLDNEASYKIIQEIAKLGKPFGAICISPRILAKAGVLKNKKATGWESKDNPVAPVFKKYGVIYEKKGVVIDGNIVTATCPANAAEFGNAIIKLLKKENKETI